MKPIELKDIPSQVIAAALLHELDRDSKKTNDLFSFEDTVNYRHNLVKLYAKLFMQSDEIKYANILEFKKRCEQTIYAFNEMYHEADFPVVVSQDKRLYNITSDLVYVINNGEKEQSVQVYYKKENEDERFKQITALCIGGVKYEQLIEAEQPIEKE